ncbi:uncharacterized protein LOC111698224 [Eurytemora carolleeae]|uniref:uncharacterized protein LOC111698224 n=1 Tax=Eurytemora carolleeae TaxID=1294199 RepID=UPI000C792B07|nr:uncharacterized protein LOC111698224 [Eurytemora carolleeae]|eukprot:XP_023324274.1 uncharacterized protein LOC111698224 [Eurytemora affinis]
MMKNIIFVLFSTLHIHQTTSFTLQIKKFEFPALPEMQMNFIPKPAKLQQMEKFTVPEVHLEEMVRGPDNNILELFLELNFDYSDLVPPVKSLYFRVPMVMDKYSRTP